MNRPARYRTRLRVVLVLLLVCTVAGACGTDARGDGAESETPHHSGSGFPVTLETEFGDVTIDERPERVVGLGWGDAGTALALGVQPVGASDWLGFGGTGVGPWAAKLYDEPPELVGTQEPNLEKIATLRPDLILDVNSSGDMKRYESLSRIAPVVGIPPGAGHYTTGWRKQTTMISKALGKPDKGRRLIERIEQKFRATARQFPQFEGKTIAIAARTSEGWSAYTSADARVRFAESLGFTNSQRIQQRAGDSFSIDVSTERLDLLDADLTVVIPIYVEASKVTRDPLFQQVPSVADGRVVVLRDSAVRKAFSTNTALSIEYALAHVPNQLAKALDN